MSEQRGFEYGGSGGGDGGRCSGIGMEFEGNTKSFKVWRGK